MELNGIEKIHISLSEILKKKSGGKKTDAGFLKKEIEKDNILEKEWLSLKINELEKSGHK